MLSTPRTLRDLPFSIFCLTSSALTSHTVSLRLDPKLFRKSPLCIFRPGFRILYVMPG